MAKNHDARVRRYQDRIVISVEPISREAWRLVREALLVARKSVHEKATGFTPPREVDSAAVMTALGCAESSVEHAATAAEEFLRKQGANIIPPPARSDAC